MPDIFSVITINYNNLEGLKRTLESVWSQTAIDKIQFIVIDGYSTDGSVEYLNLHRKRIDILVTEKDKGIYDAMNKGLAAASGEYVWFVNSGDAIYDPHVTESLLPLVEKDPDVIFGDTMFIEQDGSEIGLISKLKPQPLPEKLGPGSFRYGMCVCHQSFIVKRKRAPIYDLQYRQAADIDWIIKVLNAEPVSVKYDGIISSFETGGSSYQNEKKAWKERFTVLKRNYGAVPNLLAHLWIVIRRILFKMGVWRP